MRQNRIIVGAEDGKEIIVSVNGIDISDWIDAGWVLEQDNDAGLVHLHVVFSAYQKSEES